MTYRTKQFPSDHEATETPADTTPTDPIDSSDNTETEKPAGETTAGPEVISPSVSDDTSNATGSTSMPASGIAQSAVTAVVPKKKWYRVGFRPEKVFPGF